MSHSGGNVQGYSRQLAHVGQLLRQLKAGAQNASPETLASLFLIKEEDELFWELVAFRVRGHPALLLGAMCFRRQTGTAGSYSRRSLISYLSSPPKELGLTRSARPAGMIEILLPGVDEDIISFRARMQQGDSASAMFLEADTIDFAFDFRTRNPSVDIPVIRANAVETYLVRTVRGHVLMGHVHDFHTKLHHEKSFIALINPVQFIHSGQQLVPTLAIHRSFISMTAQLPSREASTEWVSSSVPFHASMAEQRYLLSPDLGGATDAGRANPDRSMAAVG